MTETSIPLRLLIVANSEIKEFIDNASPSKQLHPGASLTIEDSILSIMNHVLQHKTSFSALSDLLSLITLYLPTECHRTFTVTILFEESFFMLSVRIIIGAMLII